MLLFDAETKSDMSGERARLLKRAASSPSPPRNLKRSQSVDVLEKYQQFLKVFEPPDPRTIVFQMPDDVDIVKSVHEHVREMKQPLRRAHASAIRFDYMLFDQVAINQTDFVYVPKVDERAISQLYGGIQHTRRPWMDYFISDVGCFEFDGVYLYSVSSIITKPEFTHYPRWFFIDLFCQWRFYGRKTRSEPQALAQSWSTFLTILRPSLKGFVDALRALRHKFFETTTIGILMLIHVHSHQLGLKCSVPPRFDCPCCYRHDRHVFPDGDVPSEHVLLQYLHDHLLVRTPREQARLEDDAKKVVRAHLQMCIESQADAIAKELVARSTQRLGE